MQKHEEELQKAFHERKKDNEVYKKKQRENSRRVYQRDKERIIARARANQRRVQELEQLERLHESKEQGWYFVFSRKMKQNPQKTTENLQMRPQNLQIGHKIFKK